MNKKLIFWHDAKVMRWVDGDTVDLEVDLGFGVSFNTRFRLNGVDTPERGQPLYKEATAFCDEHAPVGSKVLIKTYGEDKYGRWLADVFINGKIINDLLIESGFAKIYGH